ncbi:hypothetical protein [Streptomyces stelliscabiei]|uniref:hypothetical protein n=1 Tax=Streptomyces stelliscabiei TaxID=146820 RepID=UPI002FF0BE74
MSATATTAPDAGTADRLLRVEDLTVELGHGAAARRVLKGISFDIPGAAPSHSSASPGRARPRSRGHSSASTGRRGAGSSWTAPRCAPHADGREPRRSR